uniref:Prolyl oligopeptidase family protein n=1 Tax=Fischerella sp. MV11 TaxID=397321 RepID=E1U3T4_9CYAN|nr:prolyl oligopeptidase family protein [Fischerella sp. MV11]
MTKQPKPPVAPVKPVTNDYFGTKVTDNYRYMENFNDQQVQQWVKAQADDFFGNDPRIAKNDPRVAGILLGINTWTKFYSIYEYDSQTNQLTQIQLQPQGKYDALDDLVAQEIEVRSHDGTMIPLSIVHKKDIKLDGSNPC